MAKNRSIKKIIAMVLVCALAISTLPGGAAVTEGVYDGVVDTSTPQWVVVYSGVYNELLHYQVEERRTEYAVTIRTSITGLYDSELTGQLVIPSEVPAVIDGETVILPVTRISMSPGYRLTSVIIPASVTVISSGSFPPTLEFATFSSTSPPSLGSIDFMNEGMVALEGVFGAYQRFLATTVYVPIGSIAAYRGRGQLRLLNIVGVDENGNIICERCMSFRDDCDCMRCSDCGQLGSKFGNRCLCRRGCGATTLTNCECPACCEHFPVTCVHVYCRFCEQSPFRCMCCPVCESFLRSLCVCCDVCKRKPNLCAYYPNCIREHHYCICICDCGQPESDPTNCICCPDCGYHRYDRCMCLCPGGCGELKRYPNNCNCCPDCRYYLCICECYCGVYKRYPDECLCICPGGCGELQRYPENCRCCPDCRFYLCICECYCGVYIRYPDECLCECPGCEELLRICTQRTLGQVRGAGYVGMPDALQILRFIAGLSNVLVNADGEICIGAWNAARIVNYGNNPAPIVQDALQILRYLVNLRNLIVTPQPN